MSAPSPQVIERARESFDSSVDVAIVGAGAAGLVAALAAREAGVSVMLFERDVTPSGSTSLSAGLIPAAGTRWQQNVGIEDDVAQFTNDIVAKSAHNADRPLAEAIAAESASTLHWLNDSWSVPLSLVEGFTYPGHSVLRMHGTPARTGAELIGSLVRAAEEAGASLVTDARVTRLYRDGRLMSGLGIQRGEVVEDIGAANVILACNGYGANPSLVERYLPSMRNALYFGHPGNTGDAVLWGEQLGAASANLSGFQGHGSVAKPHGILITWAVMMEGGFQVNQDGARFSNEHAGYSEQAEHVIAQPGHVAFNIFDQRLFDIAHQFEDFVDAERHGALIKADSVAELAHLVGLPEAPLSETFNAVDRLALENATDRFGRRFETNKRLKPPYYAVRVEGALFHTQGGLDIDHGARVLHRDGTAFENLYATGGAARGVSGTDASGYLSGNGLLTAVVLGAIAGRATADNLQGDTRHAKP